MTQNKKIKTKQKDSTQKPLPKEVKKAFNQFMNAHFGDQMCKECKKEYFSED